MDMGGLPENAPTWGVPIVFFFVRKLDADAHFC